MEEKKLNSAENVNVVVENLSKEKNQQSKC